MATKNGKRGLCAVLAGVMLASMVPMMPARAATEVEPEQDGTVPEGNYVLAWHDEFDGTELDLTKWDYQLGNGSDYGIPGWGNSEKQNYTNNPENIRVEDGKLIITALESGNGKYTSARIRTYSKELDEALYAPEYGYIEAKMTLPEGDGLWPAFWMLPATDDYTTWAASGEVDIMEARGRLTDEVGGTIHYGETWPNNKRNGGVYEFPEGQDITGEHVYGVEWNPGEFIWYVDGEEYYRTSNWYAKGAGEADNYTYPAPFDKPFYILLNLAVGGTYDGNLLPDSEDMPAQMTVDYVRVYQNADGYDDSNVAPPTDKDVASFEEYQQRADENGNLVLDPTFTTANVVADANTNLDATNNKWYYLAGSGFGGKAGDLTTTVDENGTTWANIPVTAGGAYSYAIQLIQHMGLANGYTYEVSFDAYTDQANQTIRMKMGGDADNAWGAYSNEFKADLTSVPQHFSYTFDMTSASDPTARLELCFGLATGTVSISNIQVKPVEKAGNTDESKDPLVNGNHIYNGTFDQGTARLGFWHTSGTASVNEDSQLVMEKGAKVWQIGTQLMQTDEYELTFDAMGGDNAKLIVEFLNADGTVKYGQANVFPTTEMGKQTVTFTMPEGDSDMNAMVRISAAGNSCVVDNVFLKRTTNNNMDYTNTKIYPIENSDFSIGMNGWTPFGRGMSPEIVDGALEIEAGPMGPNPWGRMLMYTNMPLLSGGTYQLSFRVKSDAAGVGESIQVKIEDSSYVPTMDNTFTLSEEWQTVTYTFNSSLELGDLKFLLAAAKKDCLVYFDDVVLKLADAGDIKQAPMLVPVQDEPTLDNPILLQVNNTEWLASINTVLVNNEAVDEGLWSIEGTMLKLDPDAFGVQGNYTVKVLADGYDYTAVSLAVKAGTGVEPTPEPTPEPSDVNKDYLQKYYDELKSEPTDDLVAAVKEQVAEALATAEAVLADKDATQTEVNEAVMMVIRALNALSMVQGDTTDLEYFVAEAQKMVDDADKYVSENWDQLTAALDAALAVIDDDNALQGDVDDAIWDLLDAMSAQKLKANKENLDALIGQAEEMDLTGYTAESVAVFRTALANAKAVMADATLSVDDQKTVDAAVAELNAAVQGLTASGDTQPEESQEPEQTQTPEETQEPEQTQAPQQTKEPEASVPQTGDASQLMTWVAVLTVASGAMAVVAYDRKRKHEN